MRARAFGTLKIAAALILACGGAAFAQESFFKGKTIRIIVGFSAGGGYDTYARVIARHLPKYIPGNPTVAVENMAGAGSMISANHIYKAAKPDGLTIGHFIGGLFLQQLLGKPGIEFDARRFEYLGVPAQDEFMLGVSRASGITSADQLMASKSPLKLGGVATGSGTDDLPNVLKATIGLPVQLVSGYKGTADIRLAFNSGEVQGLSNSWQSFRATWRKELDAGDLVIVLQETLTPHAELAHVPLALNFAKTEEAKKLIRTVIQVHGPTVRPFVLPPGTPKERVQLLRKAFIEALKDPELLAEAKKARLEINPLDGAELERGVKEILNLDAALAAKLKEVLR
ncbi:MAG TPA: tripartite tricarboxylate transporter substrate-binding protein [candidate division Zixibacteria bacterium]|nr:tripartite tricarboxylate transporter substrate-binding protein [candidate division Zixibacteria bacterium]